MPVPRSRLWTYLGLLPLLAGAIYLASWVEDAPLVADEQTINMQATEADYYLEQFTTRKFDAAGALEYLAVGQSLAHYPDNDRSEITSPSITLKRPAAIWKIVATSGTLTPDPDLFTLSGEVRLTRTGQNGEALTVLTETLSLDPKGNVVQTDAPIDLQAQNWTLSSTGLRSELDAGTLDLLGNVVGRYEPPITTEPGTSTR